MSLLQVLAIMLREPGPVSLGHQPASRLSWPIFALGHPLRSEAANNDIRQQRLRPKSMTVMSGVQAGVLPHEQTATQISTTLDSLSRNPNNIGTLESSRILSLDQCAVGLVLRFGFETCYETL
ncbi:hypothetical protein AMATHDRAFT_65015, partial [Amanita thiersii Skay4041]